MRTLILIALALVLSGCGSAPRYSTSASTSSVTAAAPAGVDLPLKTQVGIYMSPDDLAKKVRFQYYYEGYWFEEGQAIQRAALAVFRHLFESVAPLDDTLKPEFVIRVKGRMVQNPLVGIYFSDAIADFYRYSGEYLGQITASASVDGAVDSQPALERAYLAAFQELAKRLLENEKMIMAFKGGK